MSNNKNLYIRTYSELGCNVMDFPKDKIRRKVTNDLAEEIRHDLNMSYNFGGTRYYLSQEIGDIITVNKVEIFNPRSKKIVAVNEMSFDKIGIDVNE